MKSNTKWNATSIALAGMLGALSVALMFIRFPLPFAPNFMEFDISEMPALFAAFFIGPAGGAAVVVIKIVLKLIIQGTNTAFIGDISNLTGSLVFVLVAAFIYKRNKTKKSAVVAIVISTLIVSIFYVISNAYVMFPLYGKLYGMSTEAMVGMGAAVNPLVKDMVSLMFFSVFPFNIVKYGVTSLITFLLYKKVGTALRNLMAKRTGK